jgi:hypothetical protein
MGSCRSHSRSGRQGLSAERCRSKKAVWSKLKFKPSTATESARAQAANVEIARMRIALQCLPNRNPRRISVWLVASQTRTLPGTVIIGAPARREAAPKPQRRHSRQPAPACRHRALGQALGLKAVTPGKSTRAPMNTREAARGIPRSCLASDSIENLPPEEATPAVCLSGRRGRGLARISHTTAA